MAERALPGLKNPGPGQGGSKNQESTPSGDVGIEHGRTAFIYIAYIVWCKLNWSYLGFEDTHTSTSRNRIYTDFCWDERHLHKPASKGGQGVSVRRCLAICFPQSWWQHHWPCNQICGKTFQGDFFVQVITCIIIKCKSSKHDRTWHFNANHPKLFSFIGWHFWNGCFLWNIYGLRRINSNLSSNIAWWEHNVMSPLVAV